MALLFEKIRYIEASKARLYQSGGDSVALAQAVLLYVFKNILKLLHPFMPFVTEELWQVNLLSTFFLTLTWILAIQTTLFLSLSAASLISANFRFSFLKYRHFPIVKKL